jgi:hypothetical protein
MYREIVRSLLPKAKVTLKLFGIAFETTLPEVEKLIMESLDGGELDRAQWDWLNKLQNQCRIELPLDKIERQERITLLRPLRNSGLIRPYPKGSFLEDATAVEITGLGRALVQAKERK